VPGPATAPLSTCRNNLAAFVSHRNDPAVECGLCGRIVNPTIVLGGWVVCHRQHNAISYPLIFIFHCNLLRPEAPLAASRTGEQVKIRATAQKYPLPHLRNRTSCFNSSTSSPTGPTTHANNIEYSSHCGRSTSLHYMESVHDLTDAVTSRRMSWNVSTSRKYRV
jgi:hypothetical protein